ncbi:putative zinc finger protein [Thermosporothrix hazakensis]|jgi:anti-sigma-K factor RskA|uniref:Regulator of SigK n=1 Tax=Thermosporothrix hazakensis TaxID=644383 RepID=A0A326TRR9_THEHA|nr:anti-sigma factor [Thermosporothrix hazakensis]PZW18208.1 putative zinc finger protein [Thermosporothrix hazakensis]GCE50328.1 hypothetical protein KTH_51970 [Thermosporothrix hazakensis]
MNCKEFEELVGAYALDALSPEEKAEADRHLAICPACQHQLWEFQHIVSYLPYTLPPIAPSPAVKERLLHRASGKQRHKRAPSPLLAVAALLLLCLMGGLFFWNVQLQQQLTTLRTQKQELITYTVEGTNQTPTLRGEVISLQEHHLTLLAVKGLKPSPDESVYQGWLLHGKQPKSIGLLSFHDDMAVLTFAEDVQNYDAIAISHEPGPQASLDAPKGPVIAFGSLKHREGWMPSGLEGWGSFKILERERHHAYFQAEENSLA